MEESIRIKLPSNHQPWEKENELYTEFEPENLPKDGKDIADIILSRVAEIKINKESKTPLSHEAQFVQRLDQELGRYSSRNDISPPLTLEQLAKTIKGTDKFMGTERSIKDHEQFGKFWEYLTQHYKLEAEDVTVKSEGVDGRGEARAHRRAFHQVQDAVGSFWVKLYLKIARDEMERERVPWLRARLENMANDEDGARARRIGSYIERVKSHPPARVPLFRAMDEFMYGPIEGKVHPRARAEHFCNKLAALEHAEKGGDTSQEQIAKELIKSIGEFMQISGKGAVDRTKRGGQNKSARILGRFFEGFERVVKEPARFFEEHEKKNELFKYDGEEMSQRIQSLVPFQQQFFLTALQDYLQTWNINDASREKLNELLKRYPEALKDPKTLKAWSAECEELVDDVRTHTEKAPEPEPAEASQVIEQMLETPDAEEATVAPQEERVLTEPEKITNLLQGLRDGGKRGVNATTAKRAAKEILTLSDQGRKTMYANIAPYVEYPDWTKDLSGLLGITVSDSLKRNIEQFAKAKSEKLSSNVALAGWSAYLLIAARKSKFRNAQ